MRNKGRGKKGKAKASGRCAPFFCAGDMHSYLKEQEKREEEEKKKEVALKEAKAKEGLLKGKEAKAGRSRLEIF